MELTRDTLLDALALMDSEQTDTVHFGSDVETYIAYCGYDPEAVVDSVNWDGSMTAINTDN